jgi:hypothetical protein
VTSKKTKPNAKCSIRSASESDDINEYVAGVASENHDCELVREEIFTSIEFSVYIKLSICTAMLLKIVKS